MVDSNESEEVNLHFVGDGNVGKTCLIQTHVNQAYPGNTPPNAFDVYDAEIQYQGQRKNLHITDTGGQYENKEIRALAYPS